MKKPIFDPNREWEEILKKDIDEKVEPDLESIGSKTGSGSKKSDISTFGSPL